MHFDSDTSEKTTLLLGSQSPRRRDLIKQIGFPVQILPTIDCDETYPDSLQIDKVAEYIAQKKANVYNKFITGNNILITADTIVCLQNIIGKPKDKEEAIKTLTHLSGKTHKVISGVCIQSLHTIHSFSEVTEVTFKKLSPKEIQHYIDHFQPFDKAGAYGIQEWIGFIGIEKINGCYYNVMGLPVQKIYTYLKEITFSNTK